VAFARVVAAWLAVALLLLVWREVERRVRGTPGGMMAAVRVVVPGTLMEAALLTLFAGLWFASLGHGNSVLLFLVVGALIEAPLRLRAAVGMDLPWKPVIGGIVRTVLAGLLLGVVLQ
jgi:hypothetical protein